MATIATIPEATVMHVIPVMATATCAGKQHLLDHGLLVAVVTFVGNLLVRAVKLEIGLVVVEVPSLPRTRGVTSLAFGSQLALVRVVFFMA